MSPLNDSDARAAVAPPEPAPASGANDVLLGLLFAAIGAAALYIGRDYVFGTSLRMGPGFLPRIVLISSGLGLRFSGDLSRIVIEPAGPPEQLRPPGMICATPADCAVPGR